MPFFCSTILSLSPSHIPCKVANPSMKRSAQLIKIVELEGSDLKTIFPSLKIKFNIGKKLRIFFFIFLILKR